MTLPAFWAISLVKLPVPAPISRTTSFLLRFAKLTVLLMITLFIKKNWSFRGSGEILCFASSLVRFMVVLYLSMNWKILLKELDSLKLPRNKYAITSSGCLAVRGIREAKDVDIIISSDLWKKLSRNHVAVETGRGKKMKLSVNVEALGEFKEKPSSDNLIRNAEMIGGRLYVNLKAVRNFKEKIHRDKDLNDIKLIDKYLANRGV